MQNIRCRSRAPHAAHPRRPRRALLPVHAGRESQWAPFPPKGGRGEQQRPRPFSAQGRQGRGFGPEFGATANGRIHSIQCLVSHGNRKTRPFKLALHAFWTRHFPSLLLPLPLSLSLSLFARPNPPARGALPSPIRNGPGRRNSQGKGGRVATTPSLER